MNTAIHHINELFESLDITMFPYVKGNCIYVGKACVRTEHKCLYKVFHNKKFIAKTFSKTAALTIARQYAKGLTESLDQILILDNVIEKNYNDCIFYSHVGKSTSNEITMSTMQDRLDIGKSKIDRAVEELNYLLIN